jgi:tetratricopeptide (TPR) repeat protein
MAHVFLAMNQNMLSEFRLSREASERAEALGRELGDRRLTCLAMGMRAVGIGTTQGWHHAIPVSEQALALAPDPFEAAICAGVLGHTLLRGGRVDDAIARLEPAIEAADRYRSVQVRSWVRAWLGEAYVAAGRVEDARLRAREALELARSARHPWGMALAERVLGLAARAAFAAFEAIGNRAMQAQHFLELAEIDVESGDRVNATAHLARAHELAVEIDAPALADRVRARGRELGLTIGS